MQNETINAILDYCNWCLGLPSRLEEKRDPSRGYVHDFNDCTSPDCPLFQFRLGTIPEGATMPPIKAIRARCLVCAHGDKEMVRTCSAGPDCASEGYDPCDLFPFRFGMKLATKSRILASKRAIRAKAKADREAQGKTAA